MAFGSLKILPVYGFLRWWAGIALTTHFTIGTKLVFNRGLGFYLGRGIWTSSIGDYSHGLSVYSIFCSEALEAV